MLTIGFDFDQTLVDTKIGIITTLSEVLREFGIQPSSNQLHSQLGMPLEKLFDTWRTEIGNIDQAIIRYKYLYPRLGLRDSKLLPGAASAISLAESHGFKTAIISAKTQRNLDLLINYFQIKVDFTVGGCFLEEKSKVMKELRCVAYVGDHPNDVISSRIADALSIITLSSGGLKTDFQDNAPDIFIEDLLEFPIALDYTIRYLKNSDGLWHRTLSQ